MTGHQSNLMCPMCLSLGLPCTWPLEYGYLQGIPSMIIDGTESSDTVPKTAKPTFRPHISSAWTVKDKSPPNGLNLMLSIHCFLWEANLLTVFIHLHAVSCLVIFPTFSNLMTCYHKNVVAPPTNFSAKKTDLSPTFTYLSGPSNIRNKALEQVSWGRFGHSNFSVWSTPRTYTFFKAPHGNY